MQKIFRRSLALPQLLQRNTIASRRLLSTPIGQITPKLRISFTCTAPDCTSHRSTHEFSKHAYEKGIVLVKCPECKNRHLIADHLGWFNSEDLTQSGKLKDIEDIMRAKGETVKKVSTEQELLGPQETVEGTVVEMGQVVQSSQ